MHDRTPKGLAGQPPAFADPSACVREQTIDIGPGETGTKPCREVMGIKR